MPKVFGNSIRLLIVSALILLRPNFALAGCNADNCLRALRATARSADSNAFCSAYIDQTIPTVTVTEIATITKPAEITTLITSISSTIVSTEIATLTSVSTSAEVEDVTTVITVTVDNVPQTTLTFKVKRTISAPPTVPTYLTACSASQSRLSSACSCYIGGTASPATVTSTVSTTIGPFSTSIATSSTTILTSTTTSTTATELSTTTTSTTSTIKTTTSTTPSPVVNSCVPSGTQDYFWIQAFASNTPDDRLYVSMSVSNNIGKLTFSTDIQDSQGFTYDSSCNLITLGDNSGLSLGSNGQSYEALSFYTGSLESNDKVPVSCTVQQTNISVGLGYVGELICVNGSGKPTNVCPNDDYLNMVFGAPAGVSCWPAHLLVLDTIPAP